jgi:hypothetical protein
LFAEMRTIQKENYIQTIKRNGENEE